MRVRMLAVITAAVLSTTLSGCITVHGEKVRVPAISEAEARKTLAAFVTTNNKANRTFDVALNRTIETGSLGAIDQAGLAARKAVHPEGNPNFQPLELTDARFHIPRQGGWPKFFIADTDSNHGTARWLLVFTRDQVDAPWKVCYLSIVEAQRMPRFSKDKDGWARAIPHGTDSGLVLAPEKLSIAYTDYLRTGKSTAFAGGRHTGVLREQRRKNARSSTVWNDFLDQPATKGAFRPLGLRTRDGGALVFFSSYHHQKQTAAEGLKPPLKDAYARALTKGEPQHAITYTYAAEQAVTVPKKGARTDQVTFLDRVIGLTVAKAE